MSLLIISLLSFAASRSLYDRPRTIIAGGGEKVRGHPFLIRKSQLIEAGFITEAEAEEKQKLPVYKVSLQGDGKTNSVTGSLAGSDTTFTFF